MKFNSQKVDAVALNLLRDKFVGGDNTSYSTIYSLFSKDLYAYGLSLCANQEQIEDAIHDIFIEIYTHRQNLQKVDNMKFYFIAAFRNRLFFLIKKESRNSEIIETETYGFKEKDHQDLLIEKEEITEKELLVEKLLSQLNPNQTEAIYHRYVEGFSCSEIASIMNINYQSAKNLIHRSIKKLKSVAAFTVLLLIISCFLPF